MVSKLIIVAIMLGIVGSLGSALYHLIHDQERSFNTVKALSIRIALSLVLFILLFVGFAFGFIHPHGLIR